LIFRSRDAGNASIPSPQEGGRESGVVTAPKGGTECPECDNPALNVWRVF